MDGETFALIFVFALVALIGAGTYRTMNYDEIFRSGYCQAQCEEHKQDALLMDNRCYCYSGVSASGEPLLKMRSELYDLEERVQVK